MTAARRGAQSELGRCDALPAVPPAHGAVVAPRAGVTSEDWATFGAWVVERDATPPEEVIRAALPSALPCARHLSEPRDVTELVSSHISQRQHWHRQVGSVAAVEVFRRDVRIVRRYGDLPQVGGGYRGRVKAFSVASRRRLKFAASNSANELVSQFCLTYHEVLPDGETCKKHLNAWLTWLRRNFPGVSYLWILEFQTRGFPHFHVFTTLSVSRETQGLMAAAWNRITKESEKHLKFHLHEKNFIAWDMKSGAYLTKYLEKEAQKAVPEEFGWSGRFWGASRNLVGKPAEVTSEEIRELYDESDGRDPLVVALRTMDRYQRSQYRKYRSNRKTLMKRPFSCSISGASQIFWAVLEYLSRNKGGYT